MSFVPTVSATQLPPALDAFARLRTSNPEAVFGSALLFDNAPSVWDDQQVSGAGTSSTYNANQSSVTLAVSNLTAGKRVRQTFRHFLYQPGKSQLTSLTGVLGAPATGITTGIGLFDDNNGVFFQSSPTTINTVIRTFTSGAPVDTAIAQAAWNIDKMNGSGPSGITLDFTKVQIFFFDFQWLGAGIVRFGVNVGGVDYYVNQIAHANVDSIPYMTTPNLPLRYEIANSGTGGVASLLQICNGVISEGGQQFVGNVRATSRGATGLTTLNDANLYPVLAIRLAAGRGGAIVLPSLMSGMSTTNANIELQLLLNPVVTGTALSFAGVTNSSVEAATGATSATTVSGGTLLAAGITAAGTSFALANPADFQLGVSIAGVSDVLVLAMRRLTGTTETLFGTLGWRESL